MTSHTAGTVRAGANGSFVTTHWSRVAAAGETSSTLSGAALEQLCKDYWYPLYVYVRRQGHPVEEAQDLTQAFFARILGCNALRLADPVRGRFRTFLLTSLKHFLINEWTKANREKRGGGRILSLDAEQTETRFLAEPADDDSPDKAYDRRWALVLMQRVLEQLRGEFREAERPVVFEALKPFLTETEVPASYATIGEKLGMSEGSVKVAVHRLRRRYGDLLRAEIARTLADPQAVEDELHALFAALTE